MEFGFDSSSFILSDGEHAVIIISPVIIIAKNKVCVCFLFILISSSADLLCEHESQSCGEPESMRKFL